MELSICNPMNGLLIIIIFGLGMIVANVIWIAILLTIKATENKLRSRK